MKTFDAAQFTATEFATAEEKAQFANHFVKFVESGFARQKFTKKFYERLMHRFGFIAHYDIHGFYGEYFDAADTKARFLKEVLESGHYGDWRDVEIAIAIWVRDNGLLEKAMQESRDRAEAAERAELARLKAKYES